MKQYIHYGQKAFDKSKFTKIKNRDYFTKPDGGFWASPVNAEFGWKDWCEREDFRTYDESDSFTFSLKEGTRVIHLYGVEDLGRLPLVRRSSNTYQLNFERMQTTGVDAIELHLSEGFGLYFALYGWDCDSILIMNPDIIVA